MLPTENESYQRFECTYLGKVETKSAYGIETLIDSLTKLSSEAEEYRWIDVFMDIASSHIKILDRRVRPLHDVVINDNNSLFRLKICYRSTE